MSVLYEYYVFLQTTCTARYFLTRVISPGRRGNFYEHLKPCGTLSGGSEGAGQFAGVLQSAATFVTLASAVRPQVNVVAGTAV